MSFLSSKAIYILAFVAEIPFISEFIIWQVSNLNESWTKSGDANL